MVLRQIKSDLEVFRNLRQHRAAQGACEIFHTGGLFARRQSAINPKNMQTERFPFGGGSGLFAELLGNPSLNVRVGLARLAGSRRQEIFSVNEQASVSAKFSEKLSLTLQSISRTIGTLFPQWFLDLVRPLYHRVLVTLSGNRGLHWTINGVPCRLLPKYRHMGTSYEPELADYLRSKVRSGDNFWDVGAYVGYYVLQVAH